MKALAPHPLAALASGFVCSVGLAGLQRLSGALGWSPQAANLAFLAGLIALFFAPFLTFVVGVAHLSLRKGVTPRAVYLASLKGVGWRALFWVAGAALGVALMR